MVTTVWKREYGNSGPRSIVKVNVADNGVVFIECGIIGPRGGFSPGWPTFTRDEWSDVHDAVVAHQSGRAPANKEAR